MIDVIVRVKTSQRQPRKHGWESPVAQPFPQHPAPLDVIVTVSISTTYCVSGKLEIPDDNYYFQRAGDEKEATLRGVRYVYPGNLPKFHLCGRLFLDGQFLRVSIRSRRTRGSIGFVK